MCYIFISHADRQYFFVFFELYVLVSTCVGMGILWHFVLFFFALLLFCSYFVVLVCGGIGVFWCGYVFAFIFFYVIIMFHPFFGIHIAVECDSNKNVFLLSVFTIESLWDGDMQKKKNESQATRLYVKKNNRT